MSDPTPIYTAVVEHFKDDFDLREIVNRERWTLQAAKRRVASMPKSRA